METDYSKHMRAFDKLSKREKIDTIVTWVNDADRRSLGNFTSQRLTQKFGVIIAAQYDQDGKRISK